jgi:glycosyltransferase involved in cell wall biosynthesis
MVSIIVPIYNAEIHLKAAVSSVLNQTYTDFELILINDGSTDGSLAILEGLKESDSRIKVFTQANKGVTAARKLAWSFAKGEYITFLDADDSFYPNSLELLINEFKQDDYDIVNGSFISVPSGRQWIHHDLGMLNRKQYLESLMFSKTYGTIYASVYKKSIIKESTFAFDKTLKIGEDVLMNIELCSRADKVKNISANVYKYTDDNEASAMKVIVRHPSYYQRFFKIRNSLYTTIDLSLFKKHKCILEKKDNSTIIRAFFSPYVDFDLDSYQEIKKLRTKVVKHDLFCICLFNIFFTQFFKKSISFYIYLRNLFFKQKNTTKEVLY